MNSPPWVTTLMRVFGRLMSKKVRERMVVLKAEWDVLAGMFGHGSIPVSFARGACGGTWTGNILPLETT